MFCTIVRTTVLFLFIFSELQANNIQICDDLQEEIQAQANIIKKLEYDLQVYKLIRPRSIDIPDVCTDMYSTCSACVHQNANPKCGWCFLRNKCSLKESCAGSNSDSKNWIVEDEEKCPSIKRVKPDLFPYTSAGLLNPHLIIPRLPDYDGTFICSYDILGKTILSKGRRVDKGIQCLPPDTDSIPQLELGTNAATVKLSVGTVNRPNFVSTANITLYHCSNYESCTSCTSSPFPCSWCLEGYRCTHAEDEYCRNDIIITSEGNPAPSIWKGPKFCPHISVMDERSSEILLPAGTQKRISVKLVNVMQVLWHVKFSCDVEGYLSADAQVLGDVLYCDVTDFQGTYQNPVTNSSLDIFWDGTKVLENPKNIHVVVYECFLMADNCGKCLELPSQYECGWCEETNSCKIRDQCTSGWQDKTGKCTKPIITSFYPKSGLISQKENITIEGINLGNDFKHIDGGVRLITESGELIADCTPYEGLYVKTAQIVCRLDVPKKFSESNSSNSLKGFFEVKVQNEFVAVSKEEFSYVNPSVAAIYPVKGPKSGGTVLEINGDHLEASSEVEVYVANLSCKIINRDSAKIQCITSQSPDNRSGLVKLKFGDELREAPTMFFYVEDPVIRDVKTEYFAGGPRGISSGGSLIIVKGQNMDSVLNPYMFITVGEEEYIGMCSIESPESMKCRSPRVPAHKLTFKWENDFLNLRYGFKMNILEHCSNDEFFQMYPDPVFIAFPGENRIKHFILDYLTLEGENLDRVISVQDVAVEIGIEQCIVTSLSRTQLICKPPRSQPESKRGQAYKLPEVVVKMAGTMEFFLGYLKYEREIPTV